MAAREAELEAKFEQLLANKNTNPETFSAFSDAHCLAQGPLADAAVAARRYLDQNPEQRMQSYGEAPASRWTLI